MRTIYPTSALAPSSSQRASALSTRWTELSKPIPWLLAEGKTTKELAALIGVSAKTVESHRARLTHKQAIHDIGGLARYAIREGFGQP